MRFNDNIDDIVILGGNCDFHLLDSRYIKYTQQPITNKIETQNNIDIFGGMDIFDTDNINDDENQDSDSDNSGNGSYMNVFGVDDAEYENENYYQNNNVNTDFDDDSNSDSDDEHLNIFGTNNSEYNSITINGGSNTSNFELKKTNNINNIPTEITNDLTNNTDIGNINNILTDALKNKCNDCADYNSTVCAPTAVINVIREEFKLDGNDQEVIEEAKKITKCEAEACIIKKDKIKNKLSKINIDISKLFDKHYKPDGPRNNTTLISNIEIGKLFEKWEKLYPGFGWVEFTMLDYEKAKDDFSKITIDLLRKRNNNCFGTIINTDVYIGGSGGIHWMALFIDMRNDIWTVEFFNSTGDTSGKIKSLQKYIQTDIWQKNIISQMLKYKSPNKIYLAKILHKHQKKNSECGVYSLFYIWSRLNNVNFLDFALYDIPDDDMTKFRKFLFRS